MAITVVTAAAAMSACAVPHAKHDATRTAPAAASSTLTRNYTPYAATGTISVPVAADHASGSCWTGSIAVPKALAYRCLVGTAIADPCYATAATARQVVCAADPWSKATVVDLTAALPAPSAGRTGAQPWALELSNGARCVAVTGTVAQVQGVTLTYSCGGGEAAGGLDTTSAPETVQYGTSDGPLVTTGVTVVWNG